MNEATMVYWFKKLYSAITKWTKADDDQHVARLREYEKHTQLLEEIRDFLKPSGGGP